MNHERLRVGKGPAQYIGEIQLESNKRSYATSPISKALPQGFTMLREKSLSENTRGIWCLAQAR